MLHPFAPFLSEKLWLDLQLDKKNKSPLMYKSWNLPFKQDPSFKKSHAKIDWLIKLISSIRSSKIDLEVSPGSYIDISLEGIKKDKIKIINNNLTIFKRLGRINNVYSSSLNKNSVKIIFDAETISLYFDKDIDLLEQKEKITNQVNNLVKKISTLNKKLQNKSFLDNAPTLIVQKEKKSLINSNIELKKLNSILNSIKN
jgi:valyl-tRNA synthetase